MLRLLGIEPDESLRCYALRYEDLLLSMCHGSFDTCDWTKLREHMQRHSKNEARISTCAGADAACYARRYADVAHKYCPGGQVSPSCSWEDVLHHWLEIGRAGKRTFGCEQTAIDPLAPQLRYSGFVDGGMQTSIQRAIFERQYSQMDLSGFGFASVQGAGARVRWRTSAQRVVLRVEYYPRESATCSEDCAIDLDKTTCYTRGAPIQHLAEQAPESTRDGTCHAQCRLTLFVDGREADAELTQPRGSFKGPLHFQIMSQMLPQWHDYELVMPWGASVDFLGLDLEGDAGKPALEALPESRLLKYVAFGDSITHGWCSRDASYPELLARLNNWEAVNMGIQGLGLFDASENGVGHAIAEQRGDLATILIGINDACRNGGVEESGAALARLLDEVREQAPLLPVAVLTATATAIEWCGPNGVELFREQTRHVVASRLARGDARLSLIEGQALVPKAYLYEGLHPTTKGVHELSHNLNAELGFTRVRVTLQHCEPGSLKLSLSGLSPAGAFVVFHGVNYAGLAQREGSVVEEQWCHGAGIMLQPFSRLKGTADLLGEAAVTLVKAAPCGEAVWQVIDLDSCERSRLGSQSVPDSAVGTIAEMVLGTLADDNPPEPSPSPPAPSPQTPPPIAPSQALPEVSLPGQTMSAPPPSSLLDPVVGGITQSSSVPSSQLLSTTLPGSTVHTLTFDDRMKHVVVQALLIAFGLGLAVALTLCACICVCCSRGRDGKRAVASDPAQVQLSLDDGREETTELAESDVGSFDDLRQHLLEELEAEFKVGIVPASLRILYQAPDGKWKGVWKELNARSWERSRRAIRSLSASAAAKPRLDNEDLCVL